MKAGVCTGKVLGAGEGRVRADSRTEPLHCRIDRLSSEGFSTDLVNQGERVDQLSDHVEALGSKRNESLSQDGGVMRV